MFIGARDNNDAMKDIFIHDARINDRIIAMTAESGEFIDHNGSPKLILQNGERSERNNEGQSGAILLFDTHSVTITRINNQPTERATIDINEDTISNLLSPEAAFSPRYFLQRHAEGHYRIASPWLGLGLVLLSTAIILRGRFGDLWESGLAQIFLLAFCNHNFGCCSWPCNQLHEPLAISPPQFLSLYTQCLVASLRDCPKEHSMQTGVLHEPVCAVYTLFRYLQCGLLADALCLVGLAAIISLIQTVELIRRVSLLPNPKSDVNFLSMAILNLPAVIEMLLPCDAGWCNVMFFVAEPQSNLVARGFGQTVWPALGPALFSAFLTGMLFVTVINPIGAVTSTRYEAQMAKIFGESDKGFSVSADGVWLAMGLKMH